MPRSEATGVTKAVVLNGRMKLEETDRILQIVRIMNAAEIIEEISRLPEEERGKVIDFVYHLPNAETAEAINEPVEGLPRYKSAAELFAALDEEC